MEQAPVLSRCLTANLSSRAASPRTSPGGCTTRSVNARTPTTARTSDEPPRRLPSRCSTPSSSSPRCGTCFGVKDIFRHLSPRRAYGRSGSPLTQTAHPHRPEPCAAVAERSPRGPTPSARGQTPDPHRPYLEAQRGDLAASPGSLDAAILNPQGRGANRNAVWANPGARAAEPEPDAAKPEPEWANPHVHAEAAVADTSLWFRVHVALVDRRIRPGYVDVSLPPGPFGGRARGRAVRPASAFPGRCENLCVR